MDAKLLPLHLTLCDPMDCSPPTLLCPRDSPVKNTGVGCCALLQGWNPRLLCLLYWQVGFLQLELPGKPILNISPCQIGDTPLQGWIDAPSPQILDSCSSLEK